MNRTARFLLLLLPVLVTAACRGGPKSPVEGWKLVWADEFEGETASLPDSTRWVFDVGTDWGNAQLEFDTDRASNVSLDGHGHLAITARREDYRGQPYTSGRIKTKGLFERTYGRFEARIKLPVGQGFWPAFWMLGNNIDRDPWPACGEIDIMEYRGQQPRTVYGSIHGPGHYGNTAITGSHTLDRGGFHLDFHVFALQWERETLTWFVDGQPYHTVHRADLPPGATWVYDHPFFLLLNLAVGGHWVGAPSSETVFPQAMLVDWVRVWAPSP